MHVCGQKASRRAPRRPCSKIRVIGGVASGKAASALCLMMAGRVILGDTHPAFVILGDAHPAFVKHRAEAALVYMVLYHGAVPWCCTMVQHGSYCSACIQVCQGRTCPASISRAS